jgi:hypothetical protein
MTVGKIPQLAKHPPLPIFQIATDINPFHPVITDKQVPPSDHRQTGANGLALL